MSHLQTVQEIYAGFANGDVEAVIARLSPKVTWSNAGPDHLDYFGVRHGHTQVREVFGILARDFDIAHFGPEAFFESGDHVAVLLKLRATIKHTGREFQEALAHVWTFGSDGLVSLLQDIQDSAGIAAAYDA